MYICLVPTKAAAVMYWIDRRCCGIKGIGARFGLGDAKSIIYPIETERQIINNCLSVHYGVFISQGITGALKGLTALYFVICVPFPEAITAALLWP